MMNTQSVKIFEGLPLVEEARLYRIFLEGGVEYLPWRGRESELAEAYVPHRTVSYAERAEQRGASEVELAVFRGWDESVQGTSIEGYRVDMSEREKSREAFARWHVAAIKADPECRTMGSPCFAVLP